MYEWDFTILWAYRWLFLDGIIMTVSLTVADCRDGRGRADGRPDRGDGHVVRQSHPEILRAGLH